ncbi:ABC transporter permease [Salinibacterium sp.]|uniref:ABC transporter permease n=1 Tax=Salinibacterium sp. TaxID=1915057 RepID=UPI00286A8843|nr:ABC transporter permease [Salinibacterium sp.]
MPDGAHQIGAVVTPIVTIVAVAVLAAITLAVVLALRLEKPWLQPWALLRAVVQLGILSVILNGVISNRWWVAAFLAVMVAAATWVMFRRLRVAARYLPALAGTVVAASTLPLVVVFATGAVDFSPRYLLALGGIVIGNTMTVCTLMGRSLGSLYLSQRDEMEAWLSVGATPRRSALRAVRSAASTALIPSVDQTRTTGIVTLPGAFVGAVFAGASPVQAAQFQIVVLAAVLTAGALAAASLTGIFGAPEVLPLDERPLGGRRAKPPVLLDAGAVAVSKDGLA